MGTVTTAQIRKRIATTGIGRNAFSGMEHPQSLQRSSIMLLMFVLELQFNRKLLLRKRRSDYKEFSFQVGFPCLKLFITMRLEKLGKSPTDGML